MTSPIVPPGPLTPQGPVALPQGPARLPQDLLSVKSRPQAPEPDITPESQMSGAQKDLLQQARNQDALFMQQFMRDAEKNPDLAADAERIGAQLGIAPDIVERNVQKLRAVLSLRDLQAQDAARSIPIVWDLLHDPSFAALTHDDVKNLGWWEQFFGNLKAGVLQTHLGEDAFKLAISTAPPTEQQLQELDKGFRELDALPQPNTWIGAPARVVGQIGAAVPKAVGLGFATSLAYGGTAAVLGQLGPQALTPEEVFTVPAAMAAGFRHGLTAGFTLNVFRTESGLAYADYRRAGYSHEASRNVGLAYGAASTFLEAGGLYALSAPIRKVLKERTREAVGQAFQRLTLQQASLRAVKDAAVGGAWEVGTEMAQEALQMWGEEGLRQHANDPKLTSAIKDDKFWERLGDIAVQTTMSVWPFAILPAAARLVHDRNRITRARVDADALKAMKDAKANTKLAERSPSRFVQFLKRISKGSTVEQLYVERGEFLKILAAQKETIESLRAKHPEIAKQLDRPATEQPDVVLDIDVFADAFLNTPLGDALAQHVRTSVDALSLKAADELEVKIKARATELQKKLEEDDVVAKQFQQEADAIEERVYKEIQAAKASRITPEQARAHAKLHRKILERAAREMGLMPAEFEREIGPLTTIGGEARPQGDREVDQTQAQEQAMLREAPSWMSMAPSLARRWARGEVTDVQVVETLLAKYRDPATGQYDRVAEVMSEERVLDIPEVESTVNAASTSHREAVALAAEGALAELEDARERAQRAEMREMNQLQGDAEQSAWRQWEPEQTSTGRYKGAPEWVKTRADLNSMRALLRKTVQEGAVGRFWYEESARAVLEFVQGDVAQAERFIQLLGIYSPKTNVWTNSIQAVRAFTHWRTGGSAESLSVGTAQMDKKARELLYNNVQWDGRKTNSFYLNLMHEIVHQFPEKVDALQLDPDLVTSINRPVTIDLWMTRAFGYEVEAATDDKGTGKYSFSENEIRRLTAELNEKLPPESRWLPHQVQAAVWTAMKARYEDPEVKAKTDRKSEREGLMEVVDGQKVRKADPASRKKHFANWRHFALQQTSAAVEERARVEARSFGDELQRMTQTITWEAIPSAKLSHAINGADPKTRQQFTAQALALLLDEDGRNALASKLGVALHYDALGFGAFEGGINPNVLSHMLPQRVKGEEGFSPDTVRLYARAIQFIFRQDAVPWFRAENKAITSQAGIDAQKFRVVDAKGRTVSNSKFDSQADAEAFAAKKGPGFEVRGGDLARAVAVRFSADLQEAQLADLLAKLQAHLGKDVGYTRTAANEILVVNFRDDTTKVPFARTDEAFLAAMDQFANDATAAEHVRHWTQGEYGPTHDWGADPTGAALLADARGLGGRPNLHAWLRGRHDAFQQLLDGYQQPRAVPEVRRIVGQDRPDAAGDRGDRAGDAGQVRYGTPREGSTSVSGVHYSREQRTSLDAGRYGTGFTGAERNRVAGDPILSQRVYFYVDEGAGVTPEVGVGDVPHRVQLDNVYDSTADPLGLTAQALANAQTSAEALNAFELAVHAAGFDGYVGNLATGDRVAILIGPQHTAVPVQAADRVVHADGVRRRRGALDLDTMAATLFREDANFSTWTHEMSHYWFEVMTRLVESGRASPRMRADLDVLAKWGKFADVDAYLAAPFAERRALHEAFAYNWEVYLHDAKAPSLELRDLFRKFGRWMRGLYRDIIAEINPIYRREFGVDLPGLTPEVRAVMDRLVASEAAIEHAHDVRSLEHLFTGEDLASLSPEDVQTLTRLIVDVDERDLEELQRSRLRQLEYMRNFRAKSLADIQRQSRKKRAEVRKQVAAEVRLLPVYRLRHWLETGELLDEAGEAKGEFVKGGGTEQRVHKLARGVVRLMTPPGMDSERIRDAMHTDGLHPDSVAPEFGFETGRQLVEVLLEAAPLDEAIEFHTDERMWADHPELIDPDLIEEQVLEAIHNDARQKLVAAELRILEGSLPNVQELIAAAEAAARAVIGGKQLKDLRPSDYSFAAARASRRARELKIEGDLQGMREAQREALMQHTLAREALAARSEVRNAVRKFVRFRKPDSKLGKTHLVPLVAVGRYILSRYGLAAPNAEVDANPERIIEILRDTEPEMHAELRDMLAEHRSFGRGVEHLTVDEFRQLADTVNGLWFRAKREKEFLLAGELAELEGIVDRIADRARELVTEEPGWKQGSLTKAEERGRAVRRQLAQAARIEHVLRRLDGGTPGVFTKVIWRRVKDAANALRLMEQTYVERLQKMLEAHDWGEPQKIVSTTLAGPGRAPFVFGRGDGHGKAELIGALLHAGNESNLFKLVAGWKWGEVRPDGTVDLSRWEVFLREMQDQGILTEKDMDLVQSIWDLNEELRPLAQKAHFELFGYEFREVPSAPFTMFGKQYRGGYVPARVSRAHVVSAVLHSADNMLEFQRSMPTVQRGFTKTRVERYARELDLDVRNTAAHLHDVLLFAHIAPALRDVTRVLRDPRAQNAIDAIDPLLRTDVIAPWLKTVASQSVASDPNDPWSVLNVLRNRGGMVMMFGNVKNAVQNLTGLFPAMLMVRGRYLRRSLVQFANQRGGMLKAIAEESDYMRDRWKNNVYELRDRIERVAGDDSKISATQSWFRKHAYFLQKLTQEPIDAIVWQAAYEQAVVELKDLDGKQAHAEAVQRADAAVRLTQFSNNPEDLASIEKGNGLQKLFLQFAGYFVNWGNLMRTEGQLRWQNGEPGLQRVARMAGLYFYGLLLPMVLAEMISALGDGDDADDDGDGSWVDDVSWRFARSQVSAVTASIPVWGAAGQLGFDLLLSGNAWNARMPAPPVLTLLRSGAAAVTSVSAGKVDARTIHSALQAISVALGIPVSRLASPFLYLGGVATGDIQPAGPFGPAVDVVRGTITGRPSRESTR